MHSLSDHGNGQVGVTHRPSFLLGRIHFRQQRTISLRPEAYQDPSISTSFTVEAVDRSLADLFSIQDLQR